MSRAKVYDITPTALRHTLDRAQPAEAPQPATVLDDMADGILALDFALALAGFSWEARQLTLSIVGLVGGGGGRLEVFDKTLAEHLGCSDRTIRRWRAAHIKESKAKRFSLLHLEECDYNAALKRYEKTAYSFTAGDYVNTVVAEARASELYESDRRTAIERAAEEHYDEIPDAPPRARRRKPRRAPTVRVEQAFVNAARNVEKGRQALQDLSEDSRAALLESRQGEELRQTLLKLQADIAEVLESFPQENFPQTIDDEEDDRGYRTFCPVPPSVSGTPTEATAEDVAAWAEIERRAAGESRVQSREVPLRRPPPSESPPDVLRAVEDEEAEAIRLEGCGEVQWTGCSNNSTSASGVLWRRRWRRARRSLRLCRPTRSTMRRGRPSASRRYWRTRRTCLARRRPSTSVSASVVSPTGRRGLRVRTHFPSGGPEVNRATNVTR